MNEMKDVFTVVKTGEKEYWMRLGAAFVNKDGSWNVKLNALPMSGTLNIRERKEPQNG